MVALPLQQSNIIPFPACEPEKQKSNEWYTPSRYIEAARKVMGSIDLDPASCETANRTVKARRYFTESDNGLSQEWSGCIWLNPPYSSSKSTTGLSGGKLKGPTGLFIQKLCTDYQEGKVSQAIACVNADMCRSWFQLLWEYPICFSSHPIPFHRPGLTSEHHFFPTAFAYLGTNEQAFIREFSQFGHIAKSIAGPRRDTVQASLWEAQS